MKRDVPLTVSSLVSVVLFTVHLAHDLVYGLDTMTRSGTLTFLLIMLVSLYGTVALAGRWGHVVTLLVGLLAIAMPVLHTLGPRSTRWGFFFVWTLLALGGSGVLTAALSLRGLWRDVRARPATR